MGGCQRTAPASGRAQTRISGEFAREKTINRTTAASPHPGNPTCATRKGGAGRCESSALEALERGASSLPVDHEDDVPAIGEEKTGRLTA